GSLRNVIVVVCSIVVVVQDLHDAGRTVGLRRRPDPGIRAGIAGDLTARVNRGGVGRVLAFRGAEVDDLAGTGGEQAVAVTVAVQEGARLAVEGAAAHDLAGIVHIRHPDVGPAGVGRQQP